MYELIDVPLNLQFKERTHHKYTQADAKVFSFQLIQRLEETLEKHCKLFIYTFCSL